MAKNEVDTLDETDTKPAHTTSPELRDTQPAEPGEVIPTDDLDSLDDVHAAAVYNRKVMGPAAEDGTIPTPGTDPLPEPGPGPEDNEALDAATGNALSQAAETGVAEPIKPELGKRKDAPTTGPQGVTGITGTESIGGGGGDDDEDEEAEQVDSDYDPSEHTVQEVLEYIEAHPGESEAIYASEERGKGRAGILG